MDKHHLNVDVNDSSYLSSKALDSPNLSSGYCSSEDSHNTDSSINLIKDTNARHMLNNRSFTHETMLSTQWQYRNEAAKTGGTNFDDLAESLFKPLVQQNVCPMEGTEVTAMRITDSHWHHEHCSSNSLSSQCNMSKQSGLGHTMSQFNRHLTAELCDAVSSDLAENGALQQRTGEVVSHAVDGACVLSRNQCTNAALSTPVVRPLARTRGGVTLASCSVLLRHSASLPNRMNVMSGQGSSVLRCASNSVSPKCRSPSLAQGSRSGVTACDALRDHMYAMKPSGAGPNESAWIKRTSAAQHPITGGTPQRGKMSILEAFLRSTTSRFDANRGSTELAAEEFARLHVTTDGETIETIADEDTVTSSSPPSSLLKQLLTGEITSAELEHSHSNDIQLQMSLPAFSVDSLLTDGFGLDANLQLDDPLSNGIGLLGGDSECTNEMIVVSSDDSKMVCSFVLTVTHSM
jgi:hypothetical protein